jgi:hypothetical protein
MLVASEMMNINVSPSTLKEISVRIGLFISVPFISVPFISTNVSFCEFKGNIKKLLYQSLNSATQTEFHGIFGQFQEIMASWNSRMPGQKIAQTTVNFRD